MIDQPCIRPPNDKQSKTSFWWVEWAFFNHTNGERERETWVEPGRWVGPTDEPCACDSLEGSECWEVMGAVPGMEEYLYRVIRVFGPAAIPDDPQIRIVEKALQSADIE